MSAGPDISETSAYLSSRQLYLKAYEFWLDLFFPSIVNLMQIQKKKKQKQKTKKTKKKENQ